MVKQAVKVVIRCRPTANFASKNIQIDPTAGTCTVNIDKKDEGAVNNQLDSWKFKFDKILQNSSQDEVYESCASQIIQSVVQGYNGTILCYGQTGAGKTFTMSGSSQNYKYRGVIPRAITHVFNEIKEKFDQAITIRVSYVEIYNETMFDLLSSTPTHEQNAQTLQIQDDSKGGVVVKGLSFHVCNSEEDALNQLFEGELNRTVSEHLLNKASSRSHCVFTLYIESRSRVESSDKVAFSKLHLVDLAGSERTKKTGSSGITLKEATFINKSLSFLEQVVIALCEKKRDHIPYRQSKLTNLLRDSLGGNCKTLMISNVWPEPSHLEETVSTLKFATRMMRVSNEAIVNIQLDPHLQIKRYEKEIRDLKQELAMHDTLANRGRITYDQYSPDQQQDIQKVAQNYLSGQIEEITDIDSLRKVREIFNQIRNQYLRLKQQVEAMDRQLERDPANLAKNIQTKKGDDQRAEEAKQGEQSQAEIVTGEDGIKQKRKNIDKQQAFLEYKQDGEGQALEKTIIQCRHELKDRKSQIQYLTQIINKVKSEMDQVKSRLDHKTEEKKLTMKDEFNSEAFDDEGAAAEEIIDEEELMLLKEMKDLKKNYRENYDKLKMLKQEINDLQTNIDNMKQQLISNFEGWYAEEFDQVQPNMEETYNQTLKQQYQTYKGDQLLRNEEELDDDAMAFIRAKKNVDTLQKPKSTFSSIRAHAYIKQMNYDKYNIPRYKQFIHEVSAVIIARAFILAPLERMKIVMQVKHIAQFVNPSDKPKNVLDLSNNLAHGRMAADMSKKIPISLQKGTPLAQNLPKHKLYSSVRNCFQTTYSENGSKGTYKNYFKGVQIALLSQIPYTIILMSSFEFFSSIFQSQNQTFNKFDDYLFFYKFLTRLGAPTISITLAQSLCYPLDTMKRRMQLNGSLGHKNLYRSNLNCLTKIYNEEGIRGFYGGFSVNLIRCIPLAFIQYIYNLQQLYTAIDESPSSPTQIEDWQKRFSVPLSSTKEDCEAIPFIKFIQQEGRFELNPEAGEFLLSLNETKLGVVAVCGKYRTGKSYLLNKLFIEDYFQTGANQGNKTKEESVRVQETSRASGFQVSPTINPCTKGLWIWKKVIYSEQNECPMIVIDTEGLGAFDEDENHDAKIFLLALLLSSMIIYNSVGTIDENALNNLSLVINLSKKIQIKNQSDNAEDIDELASIFPSFLWVLRDFTLKLVDNDGNRISSKQYLENALKEQKGCSETVEQKNRIRRLLKHFFQDRDCCTLIRPTEKEKDLQDLARMKDNLLRKEFIDQMTKLKTKVMTKVKAKVLNGHQLNGPMILELANSYIMALNDGKVPNIENAWSNVCNFEQERSFKNSIKYFQDQVVLKFKENIHDGKNFNVKEIVTSIKEKSISFFKANFLGEIKSLDVYEKKLKQEIKKLSLQFIKEFKDKQDYEIMKQIQFEFHEKIEVRVRRGEILSTDQIEKEIDDLLTSLQVQYCHDQEHVENIYRRYAQTKIYKLMDSFVEVKNNEASIQYRILEQKLKMFETIEQKVKIEKLEKFEEIQNFKAKMEQERAEYIAQLKIQEKKIQHLEQQNSQLQTQLKKYTDKSYRDQSEQAKPSMISVDLQTAIGTTENPEEVLNRSVNTSYFNFQEDLQKSVLIEEREKLVSTSNQLVEQNKQLYNDILKTLNSHNQHMSHMFKDEFAEIIKNNETLSKTLELAENRCLLLEKKCQKKAKYEELVKNCQRLQCKDCNKLYTPLLFVSHFILCKKQQELRKSLIDGKKIDEADIEESSSMIEEQFLARIVDLKHIPFEIKNDDHDEVLTTHSQLRNSTLPYQVEYKFCVLFKGNIWYVNKTLPYIKKIMERTQKDSDMNQIEQKNIMKWFFEIEKQEQEEDYQRISEIIESFFLLLHRKILENKLSLTFDGVDQDAIIQYYYQQAFIDFFEIMNNTLNYNFPQKTNPNYDELVQMSYDQNNNQPMYNPMKVLLNQDDKDTMHLDGEKTVNDNSLQFVSFFSVAEDLLLKSNQLLSSQELKHDWRKSTGSSVIIQDKSHDIAAFSNKGTKPFATATNKQNQRSPYEKIKYSESKSSCRRNKKLRQTLNIE